MAAGPWVFYQSFLKLIGDSANLETDSFKVLLTTSSYTPDAANHEDLSDVTDEVANGNGYTTGGVAVTRTWTRSGGTSKFDSNDPLWIATGAGITARYAVLYDDTLDKLVAYCLPDATPADVVAAAGTPLRVQLSSNGYFTLAVAA